MFWRSSVKFVSRQHIFSEKGNLKHSEMKLKKGLTEISTDNQQKIDMNTPKDYGTWVRHRRSHPQTHGLLFSGNKFMFCRTVLADIDVQN